MNKVQRRFYEFASFRVDVAERQLWRDGKPVPLTSKVFDILLALLESAGHTLEKDELMKFVWDDTFVEEGNLTRNISTLRKSLGDDGHRQRFIKTIPKHGYRFTADVREILEDEEEFLVENNTRFELKISEEIHEDNKKIGISWFSLTIVAVVLIFITFAVTLMWYQSRKSEKQSVVLEKEKSEAFELYKQGRELWQTRDGKDLHEAIILLEQAVQKDPDFALAHSALADAYAFDFRLWEKAESTAREAIRLDPNLGEPHATIGFVKMFWEWKFQEAENEFKQAIQLSPDYATARQWYAINLHTFGFSGHAALSEMNKALELKPNSVSINADMCLTLYFLRRYNEALTQCKKTLAMDDNFYNAHHYLYEIYNAKGMWDEAVETYFKIEEITLTPSTQDIQEKLSEAYKDGGIRAFWKQRAESLPNEIPFLYRKAQHYARLGDKEKAFHYLKQAYKNRSFHLYLIHSDPAFDNIRTDKRFKEMTDLLLSPKS